MKYSRQATLFILLIVLLLLLGLVYWPFILNEIITPTALVVWLFLRIFVLSIDQKYYWGAGILLVLVFLLRLLSQEQITVPSGSNRASNETLLNIEHWRLLFTATEDGDRAEGGLRQELIHLLLLHYASKQLTATSYALYEALERDELPLPERLHAYLFPGELERSKGSISKVIGSLRAAPRKWMRRWTGQETAEHYRMIAEVLRFMETSEEMKNDDE